MKHGEELFVGVRGGNETLFDFGDVLVGCGKLLRFLVFNLGNGSVGRGLCQLGLHVDAVGGGQEQVEALKKVWVTLE